MPCTIAMQREAAHGTRDPLRRPPAPRPCDRGTCQVAGCVVHNCHSSRRAFRDRSELCTKGNHGVQEGEVESPDGQTRPGNAECRPGRPARRCNCSRCRWCCRTRPCPYPLRSLSRRVPARSHLHRPRRLGTACIAARAAHTRSIADARSRVPHTHRADRTIKKKPRGRRNPPANEAVTKWLIIETVERATLEEIVYSSRSVCVMPER